MITLCIAHLLLQAVIIGDLGPPEVSRYKGGACYTQFSVPLSKLHLKSNRDPLF